MAGPIPLRYTRWKRRATGVPLRLSIVIRAATGRILAQCRPRSVERRSMFDSSGNYIGESGWRAAPRLSTQEARRYTSRESSPGSKSETIPISDGRRNRPSGCPSTTLRLPLQRAVGRKRRDPALARPMAAALVSIANQAYA